MPLRQLTTTLSKKKQLKNQQSVHANRLNLLLT